jgi:hypothetical protein
MTMNEYNDIREILNRWYDGNTTPAEQQRLADFFATDRVLPADLEMEREMFRAMTEAGEDYAEMPLEVSRSINAALEVEMAREREPQRKGFGWRRRAMTACAAAACMAMVLTIPFLKSSDKAMVGDKAGMAVSETPDVRPVSTDTMLFMTPEQPRAVAPAVEKESRKLASVHKKAQRHAVKHKPVETDSDDDLYLSEEEEERLVAANYHVVTDEREANAILGAVFVRLKSGITEESYKISDVKARYEMEMNDIYDL